MCHCRRGTNPGWPRHLLCNHGLLSLSGAGAHSCNPVRSYSQALVTDRCRLGSNSALAPAMLAATLTASARAAPQRAGLRRAAAVAGPARCRRPARSGFDINHPTATSFKRCQVTRAQAVQAVGSTAQQQPTPTAGVADQLQSMPQAFAWAAQQWGDAPAIEDRHRQPHTKLNFRQLHDQITCFAAGLSALGVRPGDRQVPHVWGMAGDVEAFCGSTRSTVLPCLPNSLLPCALLAGWHCSARAAAAGWQQTRQAGAGIGVELVFAPAVWRLASSKEPVGHCLQPVHGSAVQGIQAAGALDCVRGTQSITTGKCRCWPVLTWWRAVPAVPFAIAQLAPC